MSIKERIENLRNLMKEKKLDAYIIPSSDFHQSEYVAEYFKCRRWISGFTGSAGTVVVTHGEAGLWTDGRYYIQAENELKGSGIELFRAADPGVPSFTEWIKENLKEDSIVGIDGKVFSVNMVKDMEKAFGCKKIKLNMEHDLIGMLWKDRPQIPDDEIFIHDVIFAGKTRQEKLETVREGMKSLGSSHYLLTSLDDIAWLLNIRGSDIPNNPVAICNAVISQDKCYLFIDSIKAAKKVSEELTKDNIEIRDYDDINRFLSSLEDNEAVILDPVKVNINLYNSINKASKKIEAPNITSKLKAVKNETEINNLKQCQVNDCVAMVKFIKWIKSSLKNNITEITAGDELYKLRAQQDYFKGTSFDSIVGYKDHAAMMHYKAESGREYTLKAEGFLLVDSGGQYFNGTTDITRTIVLGSLTEEEKRDFTLVLKGYISLNRIKFLYGATGSNLDVLARMPIWEQGMDYKCGTGHGVGFFLNVHEGPHRIHQILNDVKLEEGMIITNEPGIYKEGKHGIRTENMMLVNKSEKTEFGQFMEFEAITYCPIDLDGIIPDMLTALEKEWLNNYHREVYDKLSSHLNEDEREWLKNQTREI